MAVDFNGKVVLGNGEVLIDLTGDSVTSDKVLSGATFHKATGEPGTGTCTYDSDTTDATLQVAEALEGATFYARKAKGVGTMPNIGSQVSIISKANDKIMIAHGFHDGSGNIVIDPIELAKIIGPNIKSGVTILGVPGEYTGEGVSAQAKTVTPGWSQQSVLPDAGYDYLSEVTVQAISINRTPNAAGGYTVTIG